MADWLWATLGLLIVGALLALGMRLTRHKHEAMVALALGEVFRMRGDGPRARRFYDAARRARVRLPEADEGLAALAAGSRAPVVDHPLVEDMARRLEREPQALARWLESRGLPRPD